MLAGNCFSCPGVQLWRCLAEAECLFKSLGRCAVPSPAALNSCPPPPPPTPAQTLKQCRVSKLKKTGLSLSAQGQPQPLSQHPDFTSPGARWSRRSRSQAVDWGLGGLGGGSWQAALRVWFKVLTGNHAPGQEHYTLFT